VLEPMLEALLMKQISKKAHNLNYGKPGIYWGAKKGGNRDRKSYGTSPFARLASRPQGAERCRATGGAGGSGCPLSVRTA